MTDTVQQPATTAPVDPRQLLLPAMQTMVNDLVRLLPPPGAMQAVQVRQLLQQMLMAADVLQLPSLQRLMQAMDAQLLPYCTASEAPAAKTGELLQLAARDVHTYLSDAPQSQAQTLFASYRALTKLSGKDTAHPADLWDAPWPVPQLPAADETAPLVPSAALRTQLDQQVLGLLKSPDLTTCNALRASVLGLAAYVRTQDADSTVWQLAAAWLDGLTAELLDLDIYAKRLASRLLIQYAQLAKGDHQPHPALLRDLLFFCAQASQTAQRIAAPLPALLEQVHACCTAPVPGAEPASPAVDSAALPIAPPPLAPALPEFAAAPSIEPSNTLLQGLATVAQIEPDADFLQSAEAISQQLDTYFQAWRSEDDALLPTDALQQAHALSRLAWDYGCTEIAALANQLERCLQRMPDDATAAQRTTCQHASEEIRRLLHQFAAGFMRRAHPQVMDALQQLYAQLPEPVVLDIAVPQDAPEAQVEANAAAQDSESTPAGADAPEAAPADTTQPYRNTPALLEPMHFSVFSDEMLSLWPKLQAALKQWMHKPSDTAARQILLRCLHTLKGSARLAGAMAWGSQVHALESLALEVPNTSGPQGPSSLQPPLEALRIAFVALQQEMADRHPERRSTEPLETVARHAQGLWSTQDIGQTALAASQLSVTEIHAGLQRLRNQIADCAAWADTLMLHGGLDLPYEFHEELNSLVHQLNDCTDDLGTAHQQLQHGLVDAHDAFQSHASHLRGLQQTLLYARLVPLSDLQARLQSTFDLALKDTGKQAVFQLHGGEVLMERSVAQALAPALEHMLRNSVAHGIEAPAQRRAANKPEQGTVRIHLSNQGRQQVITLQDDGAGLSLEGIRRKALALGLIQADEVVDAERAGALILEPGLSTASAVTELAGRGMGMDVVAETVRELGGTLRVQTRTGKGCRTMMTLPAAPQVEQVLALRAGSWRVALPARAVEAVRRLPAATVQQALEQGIWHDKAGAPLPVYWAGAVWQQSARSIETALDGQRSLLLVRGDTARWGLVVDEVLGTQEVTLQAATNLTVPIPGLLGTAAQASGQVLQVYDPAAVLSAHETRLLHQTAEPLPAANADREPVRPLVLLADDSMSVRRLAQHLLQSNGYRVITAADGLEALALLEQEELPAMLLVDVEMPDMDGMELLRRLRADERCKRLPVVMLTAHAAGPISQKAITLGAQAYLTKPYAPNELLAQVRRYAAAARH